MKRLIALICTFSLLLCSLPSAAFAINTPPQDDNMKVNTIFVLGETITVQYKMAGDDVIYSKATNGVDIAERIDNIIYLNGVKMATIYESNVEEVNIEPRTGWVNVDDCPYGTASDYTKFISSRDVNVALESTILGLGLSGLSLIIGALIPPAAACISITSAIIDLAAGTKYDYADTLYFHEEVYGNNILPNFFRQVNCTYYFDKDHNRPASSGTYYQWWG